MGMKTWYSKVKGFNGVTVLNVDRGIENRPYGGPWSSGRWKM